MHESRAAGPARGSFVSAVFLKSLNLKGFKSFADSTTMLLEPGVTVVVGPNGSGKSNVVDAVAWVLGAQAPKAVRSQKMDDVIFAGTATRPALGRAEVSITIDNADGTLGVELSEITVTRVLFRTGESEYAINGAPCRLLDVQELLSDAGVGRQQHVIVSQGQIDAGGSTLGDAQYVDLMGRVGSYQDDHRVYGRGGERCLTCGRGWVRRVVTGGRSTSFCPVCQR